MQTISKTSPNNRVNPSAFSPNFNNFPSTIPAGKVLIQNNNITNHIYKHKGVFIGFYISNVKQNEENKEKNQQLYNDVIHDLNILKSFKDDWDGYDAKKFSKATISASCSFVKLLFNNTNFNKFIDDIEIEPETNDVVSLQLYFKDNPLVSRMTVSLGYKIITVFGKYQFNNQVGLFSNFSKSTENLFVQKLDNLLNGRLSKLYITNQIDI